MEHKAFDAPSILYFPDLRLYSFNQVHLLAREVTGLRLSNPNYSTLANFFVHCEHRCNLQIAAQSAGVP